MSDDTHPSKPLTPEATRDAVSLAMRSMRVLGGHKQPEIAAALRHSEEEVQRIEMGERSLTLALMAAWAYWCGYDMRITFEPYADSPPPFRPEFEDFTAQRDKRALAAMTAERDRLRTTLDAYLEWRDSANANTALLTAQHSALRSESEALCELLSNEDETVLPGKIVEHVSDVLAWGKSEHNLGEQLRERLATLHRNFEATDAELHSLRKRAERRLAILLAIRANLCLPKTWPIADLPAVVGGMVHTIRLRGMSPPKPDTGA